MDLLTSSIILASIAWICILISRARKSSKLPPGPYRLPIIGNILHLGPKPHRSLAKLSQKYGPVMSLKLGSITTVVFSSPETAKLVLQTHDSSFSSRITPVASKAHRHDEFSVGWLPAGSQWRKLRKICKEQMFSAPRLDGSEDLRREQLQKLRDFVAERCDRGTAVDVGKAAFTTSLNLLSASLFSLEFARFDSELSQEMKELISSTVKSVSRPNLADYFPVLKPVDPQGIFKETELNVGKLLLKLDEIIDEKLKSGGEKRDLMEALLEINRRDEAQLSRDDIRHLLLMLVTFVGNYEWKLENMKPEEMDMNEIFGVILEKAIPLKAIPIKV
ncbi:hypothetical protein SASPL_103962 [Salvia splendens]|uniref:Cytochrome P450 n=1 Tax=Salvia splendens TaxID=180675 RepID=A0A8X9A9D2_SALSN|nr:hypothetical protein SASPL_103962 [Salvia splendens]